MSMLTISLRTLTEPDPPPPLEHVPDLQEGDYIEFQVWAHGQGRTAIRKAIFKGTVKAEHDWFFVVELPRAFGRVYRTVINKVDFHTQDCTLLCRVREGQKTFNNFKPKKEAV